VILGLLFLVFGRSIYIPVINKIKGKESLASVSASIEEQVLSRLSPNLKAAGFTENLPAELVLLAFKKEQIVQVFAKAENELKLLKEYPFTAYSGKLGPKLKEGDRQIPEGIYKVEYLNPNSSYHLSIKVSYPNEFDKSKTTFSNVQAMGGDIFIHGKAATIGCIPVGDKAIEEIFYLVKEALNNEVKVIISPWDFRKNSTYPEIKNIEWEEELYDNIAKELKKYPSE